MDGTGYISLMALALVVRLGIIYARVSTDEQAEKGTSIDNQIEKGLAYAAAHNIYVPPEFIFREDYTGTTLDRPELNKVLKILRAGQANTLIVYNVSRLDRSKYGVNTLRLIVEFQELGIEFHLSEIGKKVDLNNPMEVFMYGSLGGWKAGTDRDNTVKKLAEAKRTRAQQGGVIVFGRPPYGFELTKDKRGYKTLRKSSKEAPVVRLIYRLFLYGERNKLPLTIAQITRYLNTKKIPPSSEGKRTQGRSRKHPLWTSSTVHRILSSEVYKGVWHYGKTTRINGKMVKRPKEEWIAVEVPPIIDPKTWEQAQMKLQENKERVGRKPKANYLMSKRMRCKCKHRIYGSNKGKLYLCPNAKIFPYRNCDLPLYPAKDIDDFVWDWVKELIQNDAIIEQGIERYRARQKDVTTLLGEELTRIKQAIAKLEKDLSQSQKVLMEMLNSGATRTISSTKADIQNIEAQLNELDQQKTDIEASIEDMTTKAEQGIRDAVNRLKEIKAQVKEALDDASFEDKRYIIERLNVEAILFTEDGEPWIEVRCYLDEKRRNCSLSQENQM